jgi:putative transposase
MSYSIDFRKKVIKYVLSRGSKAYASRLFGISEPIIYRWIKKFNKEYLGYPKPSRPWKKIKPDVLLNLFDKNPSWKLEDFAKSFNVCISVRSLAFKSLKITRKKRPIYTKNATNRNAEYFWQRSVIKQKKD